MPKRNMVAIDGNEAAAYIAYLTSEVIAIYPITPSSPMGEWVDDWSTSNVRNLWGTVPQVIEMQSEAGAAGTFHGALQAGSLTTSFTASQGLLLMIPNLYKIAGELTPMVLHVSARTVASHGLSIFGDHSDVMACRATGYAMFCSSSVQEVMDFALIAQAATLEGRVPVLHFFDGFRTSHEVNKVYRLDQDIIRSLIDDTFVIAHRNRALSPDRPVIRGTTQNSDVFFQAREASNPFYQRMPEVVQEKMDQFAALTGRRYHLFEYAGHPEADRIIILMGSGIGAAEETVQHLVDRGERVGLVKIRLYRPFDAKSLLASIPESVKKIGVLDRTKEPGADGEPLYKDVLTAFAAAYSTGIRPHLPRIVGGRYGIASKEFTPGMVLRIFEELAKETPKNSFTIGLVDDVTQNSLNWDSAFRTDTAQGVTNCLFFGLGSDGTVSANKNSIKIINEETDNFAQGYFEYDSKKAGAVTLSHLRFGPKPINATYLIGFQEANFIACHQPVFLTRYDMLDRAVEGGVFLLNSPSPPERVWEDLPRGMQRQIVDKNIDFYVIDAYGIAGKTGMGRRINTIMQLCFFAIAGILDQQQAEEKIKAAVTKTYGRKSRRLLERNFLALDSTLAGLHKVKVPDKVTGTFEKPPPVSSNAPTFVREVTGAIIAGLGNALPVSQLPIDGTWPVGTAAWEKRNLALALPKWEPDLCTHCGKCPLVCPHAAIRSKLFPAALAEKGPEHFQHVQIKGKDFESGWHISYQVSPDDCTGCGLCVEICPIRDKRDPGRKALNMTDDSSYHDSERVNWDFFVGLPEYDRTKLKEGTIKGAMLMQPLFEFSGACVGCAETPYVKLATQLFGDRMLIANATGCSSIFGGNLPTTPFTTNPDGRGPAWANSLFEDNAEFGLGIRVAIDKQTEYARELLTALRIRGDVEEELACDILESSQQGEPEILEQRHRVAILKQRLEAMLQSGDNPEVRILASIADNLVRKSVWSIGGDGWAYDIGFGGLDHVLASGRNINILILDTEVYSNTGGQTSKATPMGAVAKFSASGKPMKKKDLSLMAMAYGNVYVAQVAFGAKDVQTLRAFLEAESYDGPSLLIAYCPCIAHGVDLSNNLRQQDLAVNSGHWPLFRYDPRRAEQGENPLHMDSKEPSVPYRDFAATETRFSMLAHTHPDSAERYLREAQRVISSRYRRYAQLAKLAVDERGNDKH
uniref:Pyruvate-flavodoxin oxidoreductase n=1 Tax=Candidatus Kentrum sp. FM TaxID=2126340 RepID=A0A450VL80_9GAMM|nr:MAG: pyruvate-ferredoxin/flavodoxin oxidoreductase [Candidatus Kentron sp. FM]VFJ43513.1 MAG: pyruvate-ferredoxin/flavodoxin oxidoreductase [Candidatus Kentron sp. FM]VFK05553.1 MAG: pyruvate-ferredoxin/flavodoxin oxidoreductase [Candidatus Kentron sp. FM]